MPGAERENHMIYKDPFIFCEHISLRLGKKKLSGRGHGSMTFSRYRLSKEVNYYDSKEIIGVKRYPARDRPYCMEIYSNVILKHWTVN